MRIDVITAPLVAAGPEVGIEYRFDLVQRASSWDAMRLIASDAGSDQVRQDLADAAELGVGGVPTFVVDGVWAIPGAQEVATMRSLLSRALART